MISRFQKQTASRIIWLALSLVFTLVIFWHSAQDGQASTAESSTVTGALQQVVAFFSPGTTVQEGAVRKAAHFLEFFILSILWLMTLRAFTRRLLSNICIPLFLGLSTAVTDESIQLFSEGRCAQVQDVLLDFSGYLAGTVLCLALLFLFAGISKKARRDKTAVTGGQNEPDRSR